MPFIVTTLLLASVTGCGYQSAPKPPGYDSIPTAQADGVPPILSQEQVDGLTRAELEQRAKDIERTRRMTHGNPGVQAVLDDQLEMTNARLSQLQP